MGWRDSLGAQQERVQPLQAFQRFKLFDGQRHPRRHLPLELQPRRIRFLSSWPKQEEEVVQVKIGKVEAAAAATVLLGPGNVIVMSHSDES